MFDRSGDSGEGQMREGARGQVEGPWRKQVKVKRKHFIKSVFRNIT